NRPDSTRECSRKEMAYDAKEPARGVGDSDGSRRAGILECRFAGSAKRAAAPSSNGDTGSKARRAGKNRDTRRAGKTAHRGADNVAAGREGAKALPHERAHVLRLGRNDDVPRRRQGARYAEDGRFSVSQTRDDSHALECEYHSPARLSRTRHRRSRPAQ